MYWHDGRGCVSSASFLGSTILNAAIRMCIAFVVIGVADYGYQWWEYEKSLRMSKQEIKEEIKKLKEIRR